MGVSFEGRPSRGVRGPGSEGQQQQADHGHREDQAEREIEDGRPTAGRRRPRIVAVGPGQGDHDRVSVHPVAQVAVLAVLKARAGVMARWGAAAPSEGVTGAAACDAFVSLTRWTVSATAIPRAGSARAARTQAMRPSRGMGACWLDRRMSRSPIRRGGSASPTRMRVSTVIARPLASRGKFDHESVLRVQKSHVNSETVFRCASAHVVGLSPTQHAVTMPACPRPPIHRARAQPCTRRWPPPAAAGAPAGGARHHLSGPHRPAARALRERGRVRFRAGRQGADRQPRLPAHRHPPQGGASPAGGRRPGERGARRGLAHEPDHRPLDRRPGLHRSAGPSPAAAADRRRQRAVLRDPGGRL